MLAQIDISMYCALINSRAGNIFIADTDTEHAKVENAMRDVEDGRSAIITGTRVKDDILDTKKLPLETTLKKLKFLLEDLTAAIFKGNFRKKSFIR